MLIKLFAKFFEWDMHQNMCTICRTFNERNAPRGFSVVCSEGRALIVQILSLVAEVSRGNA